MLYLIFYKNRYVIIFILLIILSVLSFFFYKGNDKNNIFLKIGDTVYIIIYPFFLTFNEVKKKFIYYHKKFFSLDEYIQDIEILKQKLLEKQYFSIEEKLLLDENQKLKEALLYKNFLKKYLNCPVLFARIIFRDPKNPYDYVIIDQGSNHGITYGMPVISFQFIEKESGKKELAVLVVGKIQKSNQFFSKIEMIFNRQFLLYSKIVEKGISGFLFGKGSAKHLIMSHIDPNVNLNLNEEHEVMTSLADLNFPFGLKIGKIDKNLKDHFLDMQSFLVKPYLKMSELEYVFVLQKKLDNDLLNLIQ